MKKLKYFILIGIFSCQREKIPDGIPLPEQANDVALIVYEGRVPLNDKASLYLEVSMSQSDQAGEGSFQIDEFIEEDFNHTPVASFKGNYSTLYGEDRQEIVVQFRNSAHEDGLKRTYLANGFKGDFTTSRIKMIREEAFRQTDLTVRIHGKNKLVVLDDNLIPVTSDDHFNLTRRNSRLFTLEGYFRHNGDTADFLEMNTKEAWSVTKLGDYQKAITQYHQLVKEKSEVTYIKATGFSVRHTNKEGREIEALVLKRVLQMTASPNLTAEYNLLVP
ncbi:MAG TPA: hypothetical protein VFO54_06560 [Chryseosolibacter sp.]|nr:hypothetical protein [Chryseosolibacter sp.]